MFLLEVKNSKSKHLAASDIQSLNLNPKLHGSRKPLLFINKIYLSDNDGEMQEDPTATASRIMASSSLIRRIHYVNM
jgi:hypothetical protein